MWDWAMRFSWTLHKSLPGCTSQVMSKASHFVTVLCLNVLLLTASPARAAPSLPPLAEAVVAAIGYEPILLTEVLAYQQCFGIAGSLRSAVEQLVDERLLAQEARRYGLETALWVPPAKFAAESPEAKTKQRFTHDRALAEQFLKFRFGDFVPIAREEIATYLKAHPETAALGAAQREGIAREKLFPIVRARRETAFKAELRIRAEVRFMVEQVLRDHAL